MLVYRSATVFLSQKLFVDSFVYLPSFGCRCWLLSSLISRLPTRAFVMRAGRAVSGQKLVSNQTVGSPPQSWKWKMGLSNISFLSFRGNFHLHDCGRKGRFLQSVTVFRKIVFLLICELLVALSLWRVWLHNIAHPKTNTEADHHTICLLIQAVVFDHMDSPCFFWKKTLINFIRLMNQRMDTSQFLKCPGDGILYQGIPDHRWLVRWKVWRRVETWVDLGVYMPAYVDICLWCMYTWVYMYVCIYIYICILVYLFLYTWYVYLCPMFIQEHQDIDCWTDLMISRPHNVRKASLNWCWTTGYEALEVFEQRKRPWYLTWKVCGAEWHTARARVLGVKRCELRVAWILHRSVLQTDDF